MIKFKKMHGLGNDFVIFDARKENIFLPPEEMVFIADRHFGVGCDQIVVLEESDKADVFAYFFNADGTESGACGNASRCIADLIMTEKSTDSCAIEVTYGILYCKKADEQRVQVDMGIPKTEWKSIPLSQEADTLSLKLDIDGLSNPVAVNMGNPHCVFFVDNLEAIKNDLQKIGQAVENHELFPQRTNVEFVEVLSRTKLRQITWERGAGFTLACGSGACAVAVAAIRRGLTDRKVEIKLDGGTLEIEWRETDDHVLMTGTVAYVFDGTLIL